MLRAFYYFLIFYFDFVSGTQTKHLPVVLPLANAEQGVPPMIVLTISFLPERLPVSVS